MGVTGYTLTPDISAKWPAVITSAGCSVTAQPFGGFVVLEPDTQAEELTVTAGGKVTELWIERYRRRDWICGFSTAPSPLSICLASGMVAAGCGPLIPDNPYLKKYRVFGLRPASCPGLDRLGSVLAVLDGAFGRVELAWSTRDPTVTDGTGVFGFWEFRVRGRFANRSVFVGIMAGLDVPYVTTRDRSWEGRRLEESGKVRSVGVHPDTAPVGGQWGMSG